MLAGAITAITREHPRSATQGRGLRPIALLLLLCGATGAYSYGLDRQPLGASEAYSALAAGQASAARVAHSALTLDPGKPVLYHLILHWFCGWFGLGEAALRAPSVFFGVLSVYLVFALGEDMFGFEVGLTAAVLWAFNPVAAVLARWARMYSMWVAAALGHVRAMEQVRRGAGAATVMVAGLLGGVMLYVHLGGILIIGADLAIGLREFRRHGSRRIWIPVAIAGLVFLPFLPLTIMQGRALLFGHWLDWLGVSQSCSAAALAAAASGAAAAVWLTLGGRAASGNRESLQQCLLYGLLPLLALAVCSLLLRPVFEIRYVSPSLAMLALVVAFGLEWGGPRVRNLGTLALGGIFIALLPLCYAAPRDPWPAIAAQITAAATPHEPIFFEAGFFSPDSAAASAAESEARSAINRTDEGFAQGFFRVPFDYYFHRANPRGVIPGRQAAAAQRIIEAAVERAGGAWLVSAKPWPQAMAQLPTGPHLHLVYGERFSRISVFHVQVAAGHE